MKVYVDMDGVLVDFLSFAEQCHFFRKKGKIDWDKVIKKGTKFWTDMDWI